MKLKTLLTIFITFTLFSLFLSSCDKKNASLVNRRTATHEKIEEIRRAKAKEEEKSATTPSSEVEDVLPVKPTADTEHVHEPDPDIDPVAETLTEPKAAEESPLENKPVPQIAPAEDAPASVTERTMEDCFQEFLENHGGLPWLKEPDGRAWLKDPTGGHVWLKSPD
ncbi:hypothetical protein AGMMS50233_05460 [Endomicrobiia bacterium]|nr:hypothetical protein AGMMS50233_05460 [Endomicrobiia bacterium]